jgi:hypothetical protein
MQATKEITISQELAKALIIWRQRVRELGEALEVKVNKKFLFWKWQETEFDPVIWDDIEDEFGVTPVHSDFMGDKYYMIYTDSGCFLDSLRVKPGDVVRVDMKAYNTIQNFLNYYR